MQSARIAFANAAAAAEKQPTSKNSRIFVRKLRREPSALLNHRVNCTCEPHLQTASVNLVAR
jgi:hypothetical protein